MNKGISGCLLKMVIIELINSKGNKFYYVSEFHPDIYHRALFCTKLSAVLPGFNLEVGRFEHG